MRPYPPPPEVAAARRTLDKAAGRYAAATIAWWVVVALPYTAAAPSGVGGYLLGWAIVLIPFWGLAGMYAYRTRAATRTVALYGGLPRYRTTRGCVACAHGGLCAEGHVHPEVSVGTRG